MKIFRFALSQIPQAIIQFSVFFIGLSLAISVEASILPTKAAREGGDHRAKAAKNSGQVPGDMDAVTWQSIMGQIERNHLAFAPGSEGRIGAVNVQQQLAFEFTHEGGAVSCRTSRLNDSRNRFVALHLARYGRTGAMRGAEPVTSFTCEKNLVKYVRGDVVEWYENTEAGLEQGFTFAQRPELGHGALQIEIGLVTDLEPVISANESAVELRDTTGSSVLTYRKLIVADATGRLIPAHMELSSGASTIALIVDDSAAQYPLTIDPLIATQQGHLTQSDGAPNDQFGTSIAVSGDTVVVGSPYSDFGSKIDQGAAYVFVRTGGVWTMQSKLTLADGAAEDYFGYSVAIAGDTVVVGAHRHRIGSANYQGSATVFVRSGSTWTQQQILVDADGASADYFGYSVAMSGTTIVVGSPHDKIGTNSMQGSACVFMRSDTTWTRQAKLTAADGAIEDQFGSAVAISGETVLVGAYADDIQYGRDNLGSAYVFVRSGTTWAQQAKLIASNGAFGNVFGWSVAISGDTAVIGAAWADVGAALYQGTAYVFVRNGATWREQAQLFGSASGAYDQFGSSVAISGDTVVVNSGDAFSASFRGSAYVFVRSGTVWAQQTRLFASDGAASDTLGSSVAISGDTIVLGANQDDVGAITNQGSAYVFLLSSANGAPMIMIHPVSQTVIAGNSVAFTATAVGSPAPTYQWRKNGVTIPGATNNTYTIANASGNDAGSYTMVALNSLGVATSNSAILGVTVAPSNAIISISVE